MKIKTKKQLNLPQLIEWIEINRRFDEEFASHRYNYVHANVDGVLEFTGEFCEDTFTVEVEEEITEDTEIPKLMTTFKKTCLEGGIGYQRVRIDENYPIELMLNKAEAHGEPVETLHVVNDDDTHTLIWRDGRLIE